MKAEHELVLAFVAQSMNRLGPLPYVVAVQVPDARGFPHCETMIMTNRTPAFAAQLLRDAADQLERSGRPKEPPS